MRNPPAVSLFLISESRVCFQTLSIFQVQLENRWFTRNTGRIPRKPWVCSNQNHAKPCQHLFLSAVCFRIRHTIPFRIPASFPLGPFLCVFYGLSISIPAKIPRRSRQEELRRLEEQRHLARQVSTSISSQGELANGILMGFYSDLLGFYSDLLGFYSDLLGFYSDLLGFYSDLLGFCSDLMGFYSDLLGS